MDPSSKRPKRTHEDSFGYVSVDATPSNLVGHEPGTSRPMTSTERSRKFRAKRRVASSVIKDGDSRPMTATERVRKFRAKQRAQKEVSDPQTSHRQSDATGSAIPTSASKPSEKCSRYRDRRELNRTATMLFQKKFLDSKFGIACCVCDRLWFSSDLMTAKSAHYAVLEKLGIAIEDAKLCNTCRDHTRLGKIPPLATYNGFRYPPHPTDLPSLNPISIRLISPRIPFMQIRRLRREYGSYRIIGQIINVPIEVNTMVRTLPRQLSDDYSFNVSLKKHIIHKSTSYSGLVKLSDLKTWLKYLVTTKLYQICGIKVDWSSHDFSAIGEQEIIEDLTDEHESETLMARQQTVLWSEEKYLCIAPGQKSSPLSIIYDEHAEELSFPQIYYGHPREFRAGVKVTPFMISSSEIRRSDRRGATPEHVLYMAVKNMRINVARSLNTTFRKCRMIEDITREKLESREFMETCVHNNFAFLRCIPNSAQYWMHRKKELFSMIRQLGKPTFFLTMSANEMNWPKLLTLLHQLREHVTVDNPMEEFNHHYRAFLVNEDSVTCAIYYWKLTIGLISILESIASSPFAPYHVVDYFLRVEFQQRGSAHVHILLWLNGVPEEDVSEVMPGTIAMINRLCTVDLNSIEDPMYRKHQVHAHTTTCYKNNKNPENPSCRFNIPYWPCRETRILVPLAKSDQRRQRMKQTGINMKRALSEQSFDDIEHFLSTFMMNYETYLNIIRASIKRATVIFERSMSQIYINTFNVLMYYSWISNILQSNIDLQYIVDEFSCATYVVEYVNKTNRGMSQLQKQLIDIQSEYPDEDLTQALKRISLRMLDAVEMCTQEAAWFLLRQPMSVSSRGFVYIVATPPNQRVRRQKTSLRMEAENLPMDSKDVWMHNTIEKYEDRPLALSTMCLADFAAWMTPVIGKRDNDGHQIYRRREFSRIVSYTIYDATDELNYKRSLVLLFVAFRSEILDLLDKDRFMALFDEHRQEIFDRKQFYDKYLNVEETIEENDDLWSDSANDRPSSPIISDEILFYRDSDLSQIHNDDIRNIPVPDSLRAIVKTCPGIKSSVEYCAQMRRTNFEQRAFIKHCIARLQDDRITPVQVFLSGPAGCGKTFTLMLLMETYNRFGRSQGSSDNAHVACASTGKAAVAIDGTTVHTAFHISTLQRNHGLSHELLHSYWNAFSRVKLVIIDEISMIGAGTFHTINQRLKQIGKNHNDSFGGYDIVFCGDLRQLPPVRMAPIFEPVQRGIHRGVLWQDLGYYPLRRVMRQSDEQFSRILTKIGNGTCLELEEKKLIESRFRTEQWCKSELKNATRLFHKNHDVDEYNNSIVVADMHSISLDAYSEYRNQDELERARSTVHRKRISETANMPYNLTLTLNYPYMVTMNISVEDGIVNGAIGILKHVDLKSEHNDSTPSSSTDLKIHCVWLEFKDNPRIGSQTRAKIRPMVLTRPDLRSTWTPVFKKKAKFTALGNVKCRRENFPLTLACAITTHKSQGGTFDTIVFDYDGSLQQQLVYVAMSRVKSIEGLYLTNRKNDFNFYHANPSVSPTLSALQTELTRLERHIYETLDHQALRKLKECTTSILNFNVQSLNAHLEDLLTDECYMQAGFLCLTETRIENNDTLQIEGYRLLAKNKRFGKAGGVILLQQQSSSKEIVEPVQPILTETDIGDICCARVTLMGNEALLVAMYISPNSSFESIKAFMTKHANILGSDTKGIMNPLILCGDFNWNVKNEEKKAKLLGFMRKDFKLELINDSSIPTTNNDTCIDLVFSRDISRMECMMNVSYFSYHKPMFLLLN